MFGRLVENPAADYLLRAALILVSFVALFYPDDIVSAATAAVVLAVTIFGVLRHLKVAPPKHGLKPEPAI
jgi:hypothetical protein